MRAAHPHPWALLVSLVLGGLLALGLLLGRGGPAPLIGSGADGGTAGLPPGSRAPAFTLPDAAGEKVSLALDAHKSPYLVISGISVTIYGDCSNLLSRNGLRALSRRGHARRHHIW